MKKVNILKSTREFSRIIKNKSSFKYKDYIVYVERTNEPLYHFGFSIGKKVGNAVVRNKVKRQLKNILDKKTYQIGFNCIIIVRKTVLDKTFEEMEKDVYQLLQKINIVKGECNEK